MREALETDKDLSVGCDLLIVAAFLPELKGILAALGEGLAGRIGTADVRATTVGVGLVRAGCGTVAALEAFRPRAVVLVGTCGAYPESGFAVGDVAVVRCARVADPAVIEGRAAFPAIMESHMEAHGALTTAMASAAEDGPARMVDVVTTLAVTTDDALAASLGRSGAVEHLEAFAVASACNARPVPFLAALGVANRVGSNGRSEWEVHHEAAGRAATSLVLRWIERGTARV